MTKLRSGAKLENQASGHKKAETELKVAGPPSIQPLVECTHGSGYAARS